MKWTDPIKLTINQFDLDVAELKREHPIIWWWSYNKAKWHLRWRMWWYKVKSL